MRRLFLTIISVLSLAVLPVSVQAQSNPNGGTDASPSQRWVCLNAVHCWTGKPSENAQCSGVNKGDGHRARLTVKDDAASKPVANQDTYVVMCASTQDGQFCTTGSAAADQKIYGNTTSLSKLQAAPYSVKFAGLFGANGTTTSPNPIKSNASGVIGPLEWDDTAVAGITRKFLAMNYVQATENNGTSGGQQQGTFHFEGAQANCTAIFWDPYGRVFDSQSLEPIPGARVELYHKNDAGSFALMTPNDLVGGNITNPQTTLEGGSFSYVVPDGTYKLKVGASNYVFPGDASKLQANYSKIYADIYPAKTGEEIVQQGKIQHRDVPLDAQGAPGSFPVKLMQYFYELDKGTDQAVVTGQVSHPFTKIKAYTVSVDNAAGTQPTRMRMIAETQADKMGKFSLGVDQLAFKPGERFGEIELEKVDLTASNLTANLWDHVMAYLLGLTQVSAQGPTTSIISFDPLPNYLEGVAYDAAGKAIPNAKVGVYLTYSNKPYVEATANQAGVFKIASENLPFMPFRMVYTSATGVSTPVTTAKYLASNQDYFKTNKVNPYVFRDSTGKVATPQASGSMGATTSPAAGQGNAMNGSNAPGAPTTATAGAMQSQSSLFMLLIVILVLLIAAGVIVAVYFFKKTAPPQEPPMTGMM